jgi:hypothetical protein
MLIGLNNEKNRVSKKLEQQNFKELKMSEVNHLQEIIANERLELLALDKAGNLVVIKNKMDDSERDVTW